MGESSAAAGSGCTVVILIYGAPPASGLSSGAWLRTAGVRVDEIPWLAELARSANAHLLPQRSG